MQKCITAIMVIFLTALTFAGCGSDSGSATSAGSDSVALKNAALPVATNGASYTTILGASGGKAPYTWSIVAGTGNLPAGLTLSTDGTITGTPNAVGTYTVVFKVTDSSTPPLEAQKPLTINVSTLVFTPGTTGAGLYADHCALCHFEIGSSNQQHVGATLAQVKSAIAAGSGSMAEFKTSGIHPLTDSELTDIVAAMSAPVAYITPTFTTVSLPAATLGVAYSQTLSAKDGTLPYRWSTMGGDPIPAGLTLNLNTGILTGTPTTAGTYTVVFMLEDANPNTMVHQEIVVTVNASAPPPDGAALYATLCAACHNPLSTSTKKGRNATAIQNSISTVGSHNTVAIKTLTIGEITAIADALNIP